MPKSATGKLGQITCQTNPAKSISYGQPTRICLDGKGALGSTDSAQTATPAGLTKAQSHASCGDRQRSHGVTRSMKRWGMT